MVSRYLCPRQFSVYCFGVHSPEFDQRPGLVINFEGANTRCLRNLVAVRGGEWRSLDRLTLKPRLESATLLEKVAEGDRPRRCAAITSSPDN